MELSHVLVRAHGPGSVEWRIETPITNLRCLAHNLMLGLTLLAAPVAYLGVGWQHALLLALVAAASLAVLRALLAVQAESLVYVRLLGARLLTQRRCGLWSTASFLPLQQLQGINILEVRRCRLQWEVEFVRMMNVCKEVTATSVHFWLGLSTWRDDREDSSTGGSRPGGSGAGGSCRRRLMGQGGEVAVAVAVFPNLRPRLAVLQKVYRHLQPLLQADLDMIGEKAAGWEQDEGEGQQQQGVGEADGVAPGGIADKAKC